MMDAHTDGPYKPVRPFLYCAGCRAGTTGPGAGWIILDPRCRAIVTIALRNPTDAHQVEAARSIMDRAAMEAGEVR